MMVKDKRDINPFLVQLGVALALSFAGFLFSRLKIKNNKSPHSPHSSDHGSEVDIGGGRICRDNHHVTKGTSSSGSITSVLAEEHEDSNVRKVAVDNSLFSPSSRQSGDKDGYLLPEFNDLVKEFDFTVANFGTSPRKDAETARPGVEIPRSFKAMENVDYEHEIRCLKNRVRMLRETERTLQGQLLEFYGLKEQEATVMELQNRLNIHNMEAKFFSLKIESLLADNRRLQEQVADHAKIVAELDAARAKVKLLKKKLRTEAKQNKEQILSLQKRVSSLQELEHKPGDADTEVQKVLLKLKELETEAEELRESNSRLHQENSELASQLESTQILANSVLEDPETEALRDLGNRLRQENEDLEKEVERLQSGRCSDAEELVYLRWLNACLRYELRNFQPPHGITIARDLSKSLSPRSEEKAKQLILEYANNEGIAEKGVNVMDFEPDHWSSSQASYVTDSVDTDDSPLSSKTNSSSKSKIFHKLRRLVLGKDTHHHNHGSSGDKTGGIGCSDSPRGSSNMSTLTDATSDLQSSRVLTPSMYSSRHSSSRSMDVQHFRSLNMDDIKRIESRRRNSYAGSSYSRRRFSSGRASDLSLENLLDEDLYSMERSELAKYAVVLKGSTTRSGNVDRLLKLHRKSVSLGSFETLHRSASE